MTPTEISLTVENEGDEYVSITGPEGYVCLDAEAAKRAGEALVQLADAMEDQER